MTLEAIAQQIEHLTIDERKQLVMIVLDSLTKPSSETPPKQLIDIRQFRGAGAHLRTVGHDTETTKTHDISEFYGVGAHMRDVNAQEYIDQLRSKWDDRP